MILYLDKMFMEKKDMYSKLANKLANVLISLGMKTDISNRYKDAQVISYGIELILSSIVNLILVLALGGYFFGIWKTIIFLSYKAIFGRISCKHVYQVYNGILSDVFNNRNYNQFGRGSLVICNCLHYMYVFCRDDFTG